MSGPSVLSVVLVKSYWTDKSTDSLDPQRTDHLFKSLLRADRLFK